MKLKSIEKLSLIEFLQRMDKIEPKKIRNRKMNWIKLIKANKLTCPITNKTVTFCSLDEQQNKVKSLHYNFYSEDGTLMTIDHIIPKSKGGHHTDISNLQPMVEEENYIKGDKLIW